MSKINKKMTNREFDKKWQMLVQSIRSIPPFKDNSKQAKNERILRGSQDPFYFYNTYFPHYFTLPIASFHREMNTLCGKRNNTINVFAAPRKHAKSTIVSFAYKIREAVYRKRKFIVQISDTEDIASDINRAIKIEFEENKRLINDFGNQITEGWWENNDFVLKIGCRFLALGSGGRIRGRKYRSLRPDYISLDDMENDKNVQNEGINREKVDWIKEAVYASLDVNGTLVWIGTILAPNSAMSLFIEEMKDKKKVNVRVWKAIQDDGTALWTEKISLKELIEERDLLGFSFEKEYQMNPIIVGTVFQKDWIIYMTAEERQIVLKKGTGVMYIDPSFGEKKRTKKKKGSDFKAQICVFGYKGKSYVMRTRIKQESIGNMVKGTYDIYETIDRIIAIRMEDNFWQSALLKNYDEQSEIEGYSLPIKGKASKINKDMRIQKVATLMERGRVILNKQDKDTEELIKQMLGYPSYDFDDAPDALAGAITLLEKKRRKIRRIKLW